MMLNDTDDLVAAICVNECTFDLDGAFSYRAEFRLAASGLVDTRVLRQPNGIFVAPRTIS